MGGAAGFFLELILFIGFKYKLNMTRRLGHGNPLHLAYLAQYYTTLLGKIAMKWHGFSMKVNEMSIESCIIGFSWAIKYP